MIYTEGNTPDQDISKIVKMEDDNRDQDKKYNFSQRLQS